MNRRFLIPLVVALLLPLLLLLSFRGKDGGIFQLYIPSGYIDEVNRLIVKQKLVYNCQRDEVYTQNLTDAERFFVANSYLSRDLAGWRAGSRTAFVVSREEQRGGDCEGKLLQVSETFHNQRLPSYEATTWLGRLFVRQARNSVSLIGADRQLELARPPWRRLPMPADAYEDVWMNQRDDARSERMALKLLEAGRMFASMQHIGDDLALTVYQPRPEVMLNGCKLPQGWRVRLDDNDQVRFHDRDSYDKAFQVESGTAAGLISYINIVNGATRRRTLANRLAMAEDLTRAIDAAVVRSKTEGHDDFDVHLTIDTFFQDLLDQRLGAFCRERYGRRPLRAGVTLLEADSGRVLALASYPRPGDLERLALKRSAHGAVLARNHNLVHHGVGSTTKPFIAAAALAVAPELASLRMPCVPDGTPPRDFLGYDFGTYNLPGDCVGAGGPIDFRRFLEVSSNRYMLALGLLAMADWQGGLPDSAPGAPELPVRDHYTLGGRTLTVRPNLDVVMSEEISGQTQLAELENTALFRKFRDLFDHRVHYQAGPFAAAIDVRGWAPVIDAAGSTGDQATVRAFGPVSPEWVNLKANLIQQLRQDFYTTMLGLGNNRWSNIALAESMARLATGIAIQARVVERVELPSRDPETPPEIVFDLESATAGHQATLALDDATRRLILAGMGDVVTGEVGTAARELKPVLESLNQGAPAGVFYHAVAKTGTPSAGLRQVQRGPTEPAPGSIETYSGRQQVKDGVLVMAITRAQGIEEQTLSLAFFIEGQGGSEQATALAADLLQPLVEAYWPEDWFDLTARR